MSWTEATREVMWNISAAWLMYVLALVAAGIFAYGAWQRVKFWMAGKADKERLADLGKRFVFLVKELLIQRKAREERYPGIFHSLIFYSFLVLVVTTSVVALDYDFGTHFFKGPVYLLLSLGADFAGVLILIGVGMAVWRRYFVRPKTLHTESGDAWALGLIGAMVVTGFLVEGLRIAIVGDPWKIVSPVGTVFSWLFTGISPEGGKTAHAMLWWTHTVFAMGWIATLPFTKFVHLLAMPTNIFFAKMKPRGELVRQDLEAMFADENFNEETFSYGVMTTGDLTWKQRLEADACISCGRCEEICPSFQAGQPFSPRMFIQGLKTQLDKEQEAARAKSKAAKANGGDTRIGDAAAAPEAGNGHANIVGDIFDEEFLWYCRTCMACMEVCPAMIDHVDDIVDVRRNEAVMQGRMPGDAARAMRMLENQGNPFGPETMRTDWVQEMGVRVVGPGEKVDVLYWIGCCTTFDPIKQKIASDLIQLMTKAGVDFGVLGGDEKCCGDPARLMGQEMLFQTLAKQQVEILNQREFRVLMVSCPHCYNVLAHEYPQFGGHYNVMHHSEFLHEMVWSNTIVPQKGKRHNVVYHDPCYLGRYQKIYDSPRETLKSVPGIEIKEMKNHMDRSMCCGGGGGNYFFDNDKGERLNNRRVKQADEVGADMIVTGCAYCMQMLVDSVKLMDLDERIRVADIATVMLESLDEKPKSTSAGAAL
ncbi:MAG: 4Fe-4S dicluster domain-containing protein [Deltaproteobacteria bacterium]|nr:4Fe-4S dicluster domain-containing protein [Deltaproteobacteria bacterium]